MMMNIWKNKQLLVRAALSFFIVAGLLAVATISVLQVKWQEAQLAAAGVSFDNNMSEPPGNIPPISLTAKAAIVYDVSGDKVLFAKNPDVPLPLASLTKLITALVSVDYMDPDDELIISDASIRTEGDSGLLAGDTWQEKDLSDYMLVVSSNDAATALATSVLSKDEFILQMNKKVLRMGLVSMRIYNESGLDMDEFVPGAYGSARDMARLLSYIATTIPGLLEVTAESDVALFSNTGEMYEAKNTNKIVGDIPGLIGGKTGYTDLAGGNLAIVFDRGVGQYVVVVVLGSTKSGRFDDVLKLVNEVL